MKISLTIKGIKTVRELKLRKKLWTMVLSKMKAYNWNTVTLLGAGICQFATIVIDNNRKLFKDKLPYSWDIGNRESFPELLKYRPNTTYLKSTSYWWKPDDVKAFKRRIKVVESIISDLEAEILFREDVKKAKADAKLRLPLWKEVKRVFTQSGSEESSGICRALSVARHNLDPNLYPMVDRDKEATLYPEMHKYFPGTYLSGSYYWFPIHCARGFEKRLKIVDSIIKDLSEIIDR